MNNKVYRCVFNRRSGTWVAAPETASTKGKEGKEGNSTAAPSVAAIWRATAVAVAAGCLPWAAFAGVAISDIGISSNPAGAAARSGSSGGKGASASANSVAMVGDGDCNRLTNITAQGVYGNGAASSFLGGIYGFGVQQAPANYDDRSNIGPGQTTGYKGFTPEPHGFVTESANGITQTQAWGLNSTALGCDAQANGFGATSNGWGAAANGAGSAAIGLYANASGQGALAMGVGANASAVDGLALGTLASASATGALAIGPRAVAKTENSIALGADSTTADTSPEGLGFLTNTAAPASEVSLGASGATPTRRITNLADGAQKQDVATVGQVEHRAEHGDERREQPVELDVLGVEHGHERHQRLGRFGIERTEQRVGPGRQPLGVDVLGVERRHEQLEHFGRRRA